jgi:hypothetical protein
VPSDPGSCVCSKSYPDKARAMQESTQQPSNYCERNADDGEHPVDARRGWRLRAAAEGRWDFRLPALSHADDHQQDDHPDGTKEHYKRHRNQSMASEAAQTFAVRPFVATDRASEPHLPALARDLIAGWDTNSDS